MTTTDVAIVGGGITGMTAAYLLRGSGTSVMVMEKETVGKGSTGLSTGFLMEALDTDATELIEKYGEEEAKQIAASHRNAINRIEQIVKEEKIDCGFTRCPAFLYGETDKEVEKLEKEAGALRTLGTNAQMASTPKLPFTPHPYLRIENQAKFNPGAFVAALAAVCKQAGVQIQEHVEVTNMRPETPGAVLEVKSGESVTAQHVLLATHYPLPHQPLKIFFKKAWYTTYVIEAQIPHRTLPEGMYEDSRIPYYYLRVDAPPAGRREDRLLIGGEDHRSDVPFSAERSFALLERHLRTLLPHASIDIKSYWKGRIVEPGDGLAYLGPIDDARIYYATGYSGTGLTYGVIAAQLFRDHVLGTPNPLQNIYAADRPFTLSHHAPKAREYLQEFFNELMKHIIS